MIADPIKDCSKRGDVVLDPFGGSGTAILAAERTGRRARVLELDPRYVDVALWQWVKLFPEQAPVPAGTSDNFAAITAMRSASSPEARGAA